VVAWPGARVRRYRDAIYALPEPPGFDRRSTFPWDPRERLVLPSGVIYAEPAIGAGLAEEACRGAEVTVRWRQGGERCRVRGHTRPLKHLLQEAGVPPWRRERMPLVYVGDRLAAVAGLWVCEPLATGPVERGWVLRWEAAP
jgi:tRNA(Ile)-lysidine synthase